MDHTWGKPGSAIAVRGGRHTPHASATIQLSGPAGLVFNHTLTTDSLGNLTFILDTRGLSPGVYELVIRVEAPIGVAAATEHRLTLELADDAPLHTAEAAPDAPVLQAAAQAGQTLYLPLVRR
jgi:hypothetical protein